MASLPFHYALARRIQLVAEWEKETNAIASVSGESYADTVNLVEKIVKSSESEPLDTLKQIYGRVAAGVRLKDLISGEDD
jgi:hypothetical protein